MTITGTVVLLIFSLKILYITSHEFENCSVKESRTFDTCYEDLGCLNTNEGWFHPKYRPRNLTPLNRNIIRTEFLLMKKSLNKRKVLYNIVTLDVDTVRKSCFKRGKQTVFLIHDFTSNGMTGWIKHTSLVLADRGTPNVISVNWENGARPPFEQAIANARVVALEAAAFINTLKNHFGLNLEEIHLIGHGVGAHIAGYVGKTVKHVGKITGLDPTGQFFAHMPSIVRLDINDAKYVEVLHTDASDGNSQGTELSLGHIDFYFNDALHQPGCNDSSNFPEFTKLLKNSLRPGEILPGCSHKRAFKYYHESMKQHECKFTGISCSCYNDLLKGFCNSLETYEFATLGSEKFRNTSKYTKFYVNTNYKSPYCMYIYQLVFTVTSDSKSKHSYGHFEAILVDYKKKVVFANEGTCGETFEPGLTYSILLYAPPPKINTVVEMKIKWLCKKTPLLRIFCANSININDVALRRLSTDEKMPVSNMCSIGSNLLKHNDYVHFETCNRRVTSKNDNHCNI